MARTIRVRRGTSADWAAAAATVFPSGEMLLNTDTGEFAFGDGVSTLASLALYPSPTGWAAALDEITDLRTGVTTAATHIAATSGAHTPGAVGLGLVENALQLRADFASYTVKGTPAAGDKLVILDQVSGSPKQIDWSTLPGAAPEPSGGDISAGTSTEIFSWSVANFKAAVLAYAPGGSGLVTTVNGQTPSAGNVTITADDVGDGTTKKGYTATEQMKLAGVEAGATADSETTVQATGYVPLPSRIVRATSACDVLFIPSQFKQSVVRNMRSTPVLVAPADEGVVADGALFTNLTTAGTFFDAPIAANGLPTTGIQKLLFSSWVSLPNPAPDGDNCVFSVFTGSASMPSMEVYFLGSAPAVKSLAVRIRGAGGAAVVEQRVTSPLPSYGVMHHLMIALDLTVPVLQVYVDSVAQSFASSGYTPTPPALNGSWSLTTTNIRIGGRSSGTTANFAGNIRQFWLALNEYLDLSVSGNRAKFHNAGSAANLGFNGWRPLGKPPHLFFNGVGPAMLVNRAIHPTTTATATGTLGTPTLAPSGIVAPAWTMEDGARYVAVPAADGVTGERGRRVFSKQAGASVYLVDGG